MCPVSQEPGPACQQPAKQTPLRPRAARLCRTIDLDFVFFFVHFFALFFVLFHVRLGENREAYPRF
jgi:hypothetical protein